MATERICIICRVNPATGRMKTCTNCRASAHRWEARPDEDVVQRYVNLSIYLRRMSQFAAIDEDSERIRRVKKQELVDQGIMCFRGLKRRVASAVVDAKRRQKKRSEERERA